VIIFIDGCQNINYQDSNKCCGPKSNF